MGSQSMKDERRPGAVTDQLRQINYALSALTPLVLPECHCLPAVGPLARSVPRFQLPVG